MSAAIERPDLLTSRFSSGHRLHVWPFVRSRILRSVIDAQCMFEQAHLPGNDLTSRKWIRYFWRTFKKRHKRNPTDVLFFASSVRTTRHGRYFWNPLADPWADCIQGRNVTILEDSYRRAYLEPRYRADRIFSHDAVILLCAFASKTMKLVSKIGGNDHPYLATIRNFLSAIPIQITPETRHTLESEILEFEFRSSVLFDAYTRIFERTQPKLVLIEDGHYGGRNAALIAAAKHLSIPTAEIQHGFIGPQHQAYNAPDIVAYDQLHTYYPDYFLTHGKYWETFVSSPAEMITIGNASLPSQPQSKSKLNRPRMKILVVSDGIVSTLTSTIATEVKNHFGNLVEVFVRPHPGEKPAIDQRYGHLAKLGIHLDGDSLERSLHEASIVLGCASTVLFEALTYNCNVAVWDSPLSNFVNIPKDLFRRISKPAEIADWVRSPIVEASVNPVQFIWEPNWKSNFNHFLERLGI